jgi:hypothetical protein
MAARDRVERGRYRAVHRRPLIRWTGLEPLETRQLLTGITDAGAYDRWIVLEAGASADIKASAAELETQLQEMTGVNFDTVTKTSGRGIFLLLASPNLTTRFPELAAQQSDLTTLASKGTEAFFLYSSGADNLYIVGNSDMAIEHGVYKYLNQLGWRALMPGDHWLVTPQLDDITLALDQLDEPAFRQRMFFGSGGFGGAHAGDPAQLVESAW